MTALKPDSILITVSFYIESGFRAVIILAVFQQYSSSIPAFIVPKYSSLYSAGILLELDLRYYSVKLR